MKNKLLEKTFAVLETIAASPEPVAIKTLAGKLRIPPSTLSRIAADLTEAGYAAKVGYHSLEPALGLIRLGQNAVDSSPLPRRVNPLLRREAVKLGVDCAFAGIERGQLVYLYRTDVFSAAERYGLPCRVPLCRSNVALTILAATLPVDDACRELERSAEEFSGSIRFDPDTLRELVARTAAEGRLLRLEPHGRWNICFPLWFEGKCYGISLFGDRAGKRNFDRLLFEAEQLTGRVRELLNPA